MNDVEYEYKKLAKSKWQPRYEQAYGAAFKNKEAKSLERRLDTFGKSQEGKYLEHELNELGDAIEKNVKVTDIPKEWQKDMYLF